MTWDDLRRLQRASAGFPETWTVLGRNIYAKGVLIAEVVDNERAAIIAQQHNVFVLLVNTLLTLNKKLGDRNALEETE